MNLIAQKKNYPDNYRDKKRADNIRLQKNNYPLKILLLIRLAFDIQNIFLPIVMPPHGVKSSLFTIGLNLISQ